MRKSDLKKGSIVYHKLNIMMVVYSLEHESDMYVECKWFDKNTNSFSIELFDISELTIDSLYLNQPI